jgi:CRP/FNR family transcriptional regulator, cyclic AMP receptor protein
VSNARDFLSLIGPDDRTALEDVGMRRSYPRGMILVHDGDDPASVFLLLEGRVKVTSTGVDGREVVLGFRGPGDLIGDMAAIDGEKRCATVAALEPIAALAFARSDFRRLVDTRPGVASALLNVITARLREADSERADLDSHGVLGRVACRLIELCERYGNTGESGVEITLPLTQEELAGWSGASREAVNKALTTFRGLGWVRTQRRELVVTDVEALRRYAA